MFIVYKNIMNIIDTLRKPKLLDIALFDVTGTYIGAYLLWLLINNYNSQFTNGWIWTFLIFIILVIIGIFLHIITGTKTKLNYYMGLSDDPRPK
jgi:hypothetical protein